MKQVDGTSLLVTIAEDLSNEPVLKVWALDKTEKKAGGPQCLSTIGVQNGRKQFPVSFGDQSVAAKEGLMGSDFGFCGARKSISVGGWFCQRLGDSHSRRFNKRSGSEAKDSLRIRGTNYGGRVSRRAFHHPVSCNNRTDSYLNHYRKGSRTAAQKSGRHRVRRWMYDG